MKTKKPRHPFGRLILSINFLTLAGIYSVGILLRLRQYLTGRSLWLDEAMLALNIVNRNFAGLFLPLDYDQGAPIGFLLIEKLATTIFGRNEYALRLFPFVMGILSLGLFHLLLTRLTKTSAGLLVPLALFALNPDLIYYSSELKQYMLDAFATIVLISLAVTYFDAPDRKNAVKLAAIGSLLLWFSHPALFVLAGIGTTMLVIALIKKNKAGFVSATVIGGCWLTVIGILYILTLENLRHNDFMLTYWSSAFAPMPPWADWGWYWSSFSTNIRDFFSVGTVIPFLIIIVTGWWALYRQKSTLAAATAFMYFFALAASTLKLYPSHQRLALYMLPILILLIGLGIDHLGQMLQAKKLLFSLGLIALSSYLFSGVVPAAWEQFVSPKYFEHIRPAMKYLQRSWHEGDVLFISYGGVPAFEFYAPMYGLEDVQYISGELSDYDDPSALINKLDDLKGDDRVWILLSHVYERGGFNEKEFLLDHLKQTGTRLREYREPETSVFLYLFDLSP